MANLLLKGANDAVLEWHVNFSQNKIYFIKVMGTPKIMAKTTPPILIVLPVGNQFAGLKTDKIAIASTPLTLLSTSP